MAGLVSYLAGPGRRNEHTEPHVVAGDAHVLAWYSDSALDGRGVASLARYLDAHRRHLGVEDKHGHVYHVSLSLHTDEGQLSDTQWEAIAAEFVKRMGLDDHEGTKAPMRWAAIRHGLSSNGNDHIHLVVNTVREDGTRWFCRNDWSKAQSVARELEEEFELRRVAAHGVAERGIRPGELEAAARRLAETQYSDRLQPGAAAWHELAASDRAQLAGQAMATMEAPRRVLERLVRAASTAASSEEEFVLHARAMGVLLRPRYAEGSTVAVVGFSAALRPLEHQTPLWFGGGSLARDLTLPRLREQWDNTAEAQAIASREWTAAGRRRRPLRQLSTAERVPDAGASEAQLHDMIEQLRQIPATDRETWARVSGQVAGTLYAWSTAQESTPGPYAQAARAFGRAAQLRHRTPRPRPTRRVSLAGTALVGLQALRYQDGPAGQARVLRSVMRLAMAVHDAQQAAGELNTAYQMQRDVRGRLEAVALRLDVEQARLGVAQAAPPAAAPSGVDVDAARALASVWAPISGINQPTGSPLPAATTRRPQLPAVQPAVLIER